MGHQERDRIQDPPGRAMCWRCHRPKAHCVCRLLPDDPPVDNRTSITILQHRRERFHPLGTVPLATRGLRNVRLVVAQPDGRIGSAPKLDLPARTGLLYPHPRAQPLGQVGTAKRPSHLLVLDGTWNTAHRLYQANPSLAALPHYRLEPETPERYRIRGEPDPSYRSTLEAIVGALRILEPEIRGLDQLLHAMDAMIQAQVTVIDRETTGARRRVRFGPPHPVHASLVEHFDEVRLVYAESVAWSDGQRRPVHWVAVHPASGHTFERFVRPDDAAPEAAPNPRHLSHMKITAADLDHGVTEAQLRRHWHRFLGQAPRVTAWNQSTLDLVAAFTEIETHPVALRAAYCNLRRAPSGHLAAVLSREGLQAVPTPFRGRAGRRLGQALAVLSLLLHPSDRRVAPLHPFP